MIYTLSILFIVISIIYIISFAWVIYGFVKNSKRKDTNNNDLHKEVSIIIPVRNEEDNIETCLNSLLVQNYTNNKFEIIIVNDHSTDNTLRIVERIKKTAKITISIFNLTDKISKKEALKLGLKNSNYSIIATTDADCILPVNWLSIISKKLEGKNSMVIGPVMFSFDKGILNAFQLLDMIAIQGLTFGTAYYGNAVLNSSANLAYYKKDYDTLNGYDNYPTPSGDDVFLLEKFKRAKKEINTALKKEFIVKTSAENSWRNFLNQRVRWVSKTSFYNDKLLRFFSVIILIENLLLILVYIFLFFVEELREIFIFFIIAKWLIDFILLFLTCSFFNKRNTLLYFIPVQLIYPFYVLLIGLISKVYTFEWKDRVFNE